MTTATETIYNEIDEANETITVMVFDDKHEAKDHFVSRGYFGPDLTFLIDNARLK